MQDEFPKRLDLTMLCGCALGESQEHRELCFWPLGDCAGPWPSNICLICKDSSRRSQPPTSALCLTDIHRTSTAPSLLQPTVPVVGVSTGVHSELPRGLGCAIARLPGGPELHVTARVCSGS